MEKRKILVVGCKNWGKQLIEMLSEQNDTITAGEDTGCDYKLSFDIDSNWELEGFPSINGIVNVGFLTEINGLVETPVNKWKDLTNKNLRLIYKSINYFSKYLSKGGSMVNLLEIGQMEGLGGALVYSAFEKESEVLTKSLAYTYAEKGLRINSIRAGYIDTEVNSAGAQSKLKEIYIKNAEKLVPLKKVGTIKDIANIVEFLLSEKSRYLTGNVIYLDGGISTKG